MLAPNPFAKGTPPARRSLLSGVLLILLASLVGTGSNIARAAGTEDAGQFLISFGRQAAAELNDVALTESERDRRFRELFNEAVDVATIGRLILGAHWRRATPNEKADFLTVFEDIAVQRFLPIFTRRSDDYQGKSFEIVEIKRDEARGGHIFVTARLERVNGPAVKLIWRLREQKGRYKILDISAEGLSMVLTLRQEYNSAIRQAGSVAGLVALLREKVTAGAFAPKSAANETQ